MTRRSPSCFEASVLVKLPVSSLVTCGRIEETKRGKSAQESTKRENDGERRDEVGSGGGTYAQSSRQRFDTGWEAVRSKRDQRNSRSSRSKMKRPRRPPSHRTLQAQLPHRIHNHATSQPRALQLLQPNRTGSSPEMASRSSDPQGLFPSGILRSSFERERIPSIKNSDPFSSSSSPQPEAILR